MFLRIMWQRGLPFRQSSLFCNTDTILVSACRILVHVSFRSPYLFCLLTVGVEVVHFHLITLRHTTQSVGLLWTRDRPVAETSTWQHKHCTRQTSIPPGGIRTHNTSKRSTADPRLRPRGHWARPLVHILNINTFHAARMFANSCEIKIQCSGKCNLINTRIYSRV
jgi:hypothetical protein